MTIHLNNSSPVACYCCNKSYKNGEKENTAQVVGLACNHLFHKECIASKFQSDENNKLDLTCYNCKQISIERVFIDLYNLSSKDIRARLSAFREDPYYKLHPKFLNPIDELESLLEPLKILLKTIISDTSRLQQPNISQKDKNLEKAAIQTKFKSWVATNISSDSQCIAGKIIADFFMQDGVLRTLDEEAEYLSFIEPDSRLQMIPQEGVPVLDYSNNNNKVFKMRVSKDYMLRRVEDTINLSKNIKNNYLFYIALLTGLFALCSIKTIYSHIIFKKDL